MITIDHAEKDSSAGRKKRRRSVTSTTSSKEGAVETIEWQHDPLKYGNPQQSWNPTKKAIWLLYVVSQERGISQLSAPRITDTFNRKFKQAGTVRGSNVSRDLGKAKTRNPSWAQEDTTKSPSEWFLTIAGVKEAQSAVEEAREA